MILFAERREPCRVRALRAGTQIKFAKSKWARNAPPTERPNSPCGAPGDATLGRSVVTALSSQVGTTPSRPVTVSAQLQPQLL